MADWKYIDEYDHCPDSPAIYVDTRDFHMIGIDEESEFLEDLKKIKDPDKFFAQDEILGYMKSLEMHSGGPGEWRMLNFIGEKGWRKYFRFFKVGYVEKFGKQVAKYVCWAGGGAPTKENLKHQIINRRDHKPENVEQKYLGHH